MGQSLAIRDGYINARWTIKWTLLEKENMGNCEADVEIAK